MGGDHLFNRETNQVTWRLLWKGSVKKHSLVLDKQWLVKFRQYETWWNSNFYKLKWLVYWQSVVNGLDANENLLQQCHIYNKVELKFKVLFSHHVNSVSPAASSAVLTGGSTFPSHRWNRRRKPMLKSWERWQENCIVSMRKKCEKRSRNIKLRKKSS